MLASLLLHQLWPPYVPNLFHPLSGNGYQAWSGILGATAVFSGFFVGWRLYKKHVECHEEGCSRRGKYVIEGGVRCCEAHHPALDEREHSDRGHVHRLHVAHLDLLHSHAVKRKGVGE